MPESSLFLYQKIQSAKEFGASKEIPSFMIDNLSPNISLRDYQKEAIEYTLIYLEGSLSKNKQTHILYHMATGSGKTVIMAMDILYYYSLGYRNFLFFTNQTNIVSKTRFNFLQKNNSKYLFNDTITINGNIVRIKEVRNFQSYDRNAINICFDTVQSIHDSLSIVKENSIGIEDFENEKVVLIADEAHHLNSSTSKDNKKDNKTWEETVDSIFHANKDNVLLEYTATCDVKDSNVKSKYLDKMVYNFSLKEFREAGYTKEFANLQTDTDKWTRTIQALILSEYRKLLFESHGISKKPVVLLKSDEIKNSNLFYEEFYEKLKNLDVSFIESIKESNNENYLFKNAFNFFKSSGLSLNDLVELIKSDFAFTNAINMNTLTPETEEMVNNLDEKDNHYRIIFTVDKLTEGWDVLSLFDIVRLYETRQVGHKGAISNYTISEAQLIGRGARYCPFAFDKEQVPEKRKYSDYLDSNAICETLLYHCMQEARYISELKKALQETGLMPDNEPVKVDYRLKDTFKKTYAFMEGYVFVNEKEEVSRETVYSLPLSVRTHGAVHKCSNSAMVELLLVESDEEGKEKEETSIKVKDIFYPIVYKAYRCFDSTLSFDKLLKQFPHLKDVKEFLTSTDYLGDFPITFIHDKDEPLTSNDLLEGCKKCLEYISDYVTKIVVTYRGTDKFVGKRISSTFTDKTRYYTRDKNDESWGNGVSQRDSMVEPIYQLDLSNKDWYAYNDNCGTSEEKKFVKYFSTIVEDLKKEYEQVFLIRNELTVAIFDFDTGSKFEPDYVLFLRKKNEKGKYSSINIFIEPKGKHLLEKDKWKNKFLLELHDKGIPTTVFAETDSFVIWGTPLYNESMTKEYFVEYSAKMFDELKKI